MSAQSAGFFAAVGLSLKVLPYALFRFAHWSLFTAITVGMVVASLATGGTLAVVVNNWVGAIVMFGGLIPIFVFWTPFVERKTFGAKCAHIAILTELVTRGTIGDGRQGQLAYAKQLVATRLQDLTSIWDVYRSVNRTLRQLTKTLNFVDDLLPIDISFIKRGISALVRGASRYLDAVVLSYGLARGDRDFSAPAIDGLTYCAQNGTKMLRAAVGVLVLEKLMLLPLWLGAGLGSIAGVFSAAFAAQGGELAALASNPGSVIKGAPGPFLIALAAALVLGTVIALLIVRTVRESFVQPTLTTMVMLRFHKMVQGQPLDEGWKQKLRQAGDGVGRLDELRARAVRVAA
ncbi:MAG: hypothetical protein ACRBN8_32385 [Nannocystales bacterium]